MMTSTSTHHNPITREPELAQAIMTYNISNPIIINEFVIIYIGQENLFLCYYLTKPSVPFTMCSAPQTLKSHLGRHYTVAGTMFN